MTHFQVNDMTCGHCVNAVMKAVKSVDPRAYVSVDLGTKRVQVDSAVDEQAIKAAIAAAGYDPQVAAASAQPPARRNGTGCGCGGCH